MDLKLLFLLSCLVFAADSTGQTDPKPVTWDVNGDAILPVHLETTLNKSSLTIIWTFHGAPVHSFRSGKPDQGQNYTDRAFLFEEEITKGIVSLKLMKVTEKDAGKYICTVDGGSIKNREFTIRLEIRIHVSTTVNGTVILPVHLRTKVDSASTSIRWKFGDKDVLSYTNEKSSVPDGNKVFENRASFFEDDIPEGNISLKLRNIAENEIGNYTCEFRDKINILKKMVVFLVKNDGDSIQDETSTNLPDQGKSTACGPSIGCVFGGISAFIAVCSVATFLIYKWHKTKKRQNPAEPSDQNRVENLELQDRGEQTNDKDVDQEQSRHRRRRETE